MFACATAQAILFIIKTDIKFINSFKKHILIKFVLNIILNNYGK